MNNIELKVKKELPRASIPSYAHTGDACFDLRCYTDDGLPKTIYPCQTVRLRSGLAFEIPVGHVMRVYVRSSTGINKGLVLSNGTGIIDSGFRGEVCIAFTNISHEPVQVVDGERVAQAEISEVLPITITETDTLSTSERGTGGIGSTGRM